MLDRYPEQYQFGQRNAFVSDANITLTMLEEPF